MLATRRRTLAWLSATLALPLMSGRAWTREWPEQVIKLVVPYPPGASTDMVGRLMAENMGQMLHQTMIVDNRGGASGNIGAEFVAKSAPDGYTLLLGTDATNGANYHLFRNPTFNPVKDFAPVTILADNILVLVSAPSFAPSTIAELIAYGKTHRGTLSFGSSGIGSPHHLAGVLFNQKTGTDFVHVPYKGGGPAVTDVLGGQIPLLYASVVSVIQHIKSGKLKALGVTSAKRYPGLPDVPTIGETIPGFVMNSWLGLFAPARVPAPVMAKLNRTAVDVLALPAVHAKLDTAGLLPVGNTLAQAAKMVRDDFESRGELIRKAGIQID